LPEWLIERGIGETRFVLPEGDAIAEARILVEGVVPAGSVITARLRTQSGRTAIAVSDGQEYLLPAGAPGAIEGAAIRIEVTRESLAGSEEWKRPLARLSSDPVALTLPPGETLVFPGAQDRLADLGWDDVIEEARSGRIAFPGGELRVVATPAMTLIDVDGHLSPAELTVAGAQAAARAIRRLAIGGSIGIDLPLPRSSGKALRQDAGDAIDAILPQPFERTSVNGFGFVQIIRPRRFASLIDLANYRASFEARALLRRLARQRGAMTIVAHPKICEQFRLNPDWAERLGSQVGGQVSLRPEPGLSISASYAEPA
jgi:hypothetical protein